VQTPGESLEKELESQATRMRTAKVLQSTAKVAVWLGRGIIMRFATVSFAA
jgi:hypothetical protein